ncbi:rhamnosyltransferase [Acinetobacter kookii]|uniref:Rhamnosyltransferase n=1 Tax=Acinetobacter kookii TaxID=1226327 RepID=A0A1G6LZJ8_9GAMM|nr:glycosyltransferase family 2 protein [Acinetobacter kookii]SDC48702.1 rhamnosyltransferase [Acinetobacter kookii]
MKLISVIVTYNPNLQNLSKLTEMLSASCTDVVIVDNFSKNINELSALLINAEVVSLRENYGIARAQNTGIKKALELGAKKIFFFDQDSEIDEHFIKNLVSDYNKLEGMGGKIAAIGPQFIDKEFGFYAPGLIVKNNGLINKIDISEIAEPVQVGIIISSGSLIPVSVLQDVGFMNEDFFIDYVDTEWCFRALQKGYKIYVSNKAVMYHSVGESTITLLGKTCPVHSPYRRYYRVRNLFLMKNMPHISKAWIFSMLINNCIAQIILFFTQKNKFSYIHYFIISIIDGLKGKKGSL